MLRLSRAIALTWALGGASSSRAAERFAARFHRRRETLGSFCVCSRCFVASCPGFRLVSGRQRRCGGTSAAVLRDACRAQQRRPAGLGDGAAATRALGLVSHQRWPLLDLQQPPAAAVALLLVCDVRRQRRRAPPRGRRFSVLPRHAPVRSWRPLGSRLGRECVRRLGCCAGTAQSRRPPCARSRSPCCGSWCSTCVGERWVFPLQRGLGSRFGGIRLKIRPKARFRPGEPGQRPLVRRQHPPTLARAAVSF